LREFRPTHVVHLAGVTSPASAESNSALTWRLNVEHAQEFARYAEASGAWFLYASSDFVFSGAAPGRRSEDDLPDPSTCYGSSKVAGEQVVLAAGIGAAVRLSLLYGWPVCPRSTTFTRMVDALRTGLPVEACVDEFRTPVWLPDAARIIAALGDRRYCGLLHVAGPEVLTAYDIAGYVAERIGVTPKLVPIERSALAGNVERPGNVALASALLRRVLPGLSPRRIGEVPALVGPSTVPVSVRVGVSLNHATV
jgi:dTDP-4-dehydrorhamnose reductase